FANQIGWQNRHRRSTCDQRFEALAISNSPAIFVRIYKFLYRHPQFYFIYAWLIDIATGRNQFCTCAASDTNLGILVSTLITDRSGCRNRLHSVYYSRTTIQTRYSQKWGLNTRIAALSFKRFQQRSLFTTDVSTATGLHVSFQIISRAQDVFAQ